MKNTNEEYIQLPPLPSDTEGFVVQMFWEFMKLSKEEKEKVHADLKSIVNKDNIEPYKEPEKYREIKPLLQKVEEKYALPAEYIVAFWGVETNFGNGRSCVQRWYEFNVLQSYRPCKSCRICKL